MHKLYADVCMCIYIYINIRVYKMICFQPPGYLWNPEPRKSPTIQVALRGLCGLLLNRTNSLCRSFFTGQLDDETWRFLPMFHQMNLLLKIILTSKKSRWNPDHLWGPFFGSTPPLSSGAVWHISEILDPTICIVWSLIWLWSHLLGDYNNCSA